MEQKSNRREFAHTEELPGDGRASEQLTLAEIRELSLQLSRDLQQFLFFVNHGYAHISLLCFPLVMLSTSHWLLAQAWFCGRTHLPLSPNSTTPTVQVLFQYLRPDAPVFNIHRIHNNCGHGDISAITLLILSLSGCSCVNILWYTAPVDMVTFQWSHQSYQSVCQQHPPYSHPRVTLIYYRNNTGNIMINRTTITRTYRNEKKGNWIFQATNKRNLTRHD